MKYLVSYSIEGETVWEVMSMRKVAESIGCADYLERSNHAVWRLIPNREPEPLWIEFAPRYHNVTVMDRYGNYVDSADYPEH